MNFKSKNRGRWCAKLSTDSEEDTSNSEDNITYNSYSKNRSDKKRKSKYLQQYLKCWEKKYAWLKSGDNVYSGYCSLCKKQFSIQHGGQNDVKRHHIGKSHQKSYNAGENYSSAVGNYCENVGDFSKNTCFNDDSEESDQSTGKSPKKQKYLQQYLKSWEEKYKWVKSTDNIYRAYCLLCKKEFSIKHGGHHEVKRHEESKGHVKRSRPHELTIESKESKYERKFYEGTYVDGGAPKKISTFFINKGLEYDNLTASHLALAFHCVKHNLSYSSMDCSNKLCKEIFSDSQITSKLSCGRTKAEMMVKNVLAPKSVTDFIELLQQKGEITQFFSLSTGVAKNKGNKKMFLMCVKYFHPFEGIQNKLLNFVENTNESTDCIYNLLLDNLRYFNLHSEFITAYNIDEANVNFVKSHSMFQLLLNNRIIRVSCNSHILHNAMKYAIDKLSFDIETIINKIFTYFSFHREKIENLRSVIEFVEMDWPEMQTHINTRWLSLIPAVEKLLKNWVAIKEYFTCLSDCPSYFVSIFQQNLGQETSYEIYLNFVLNMGNLLEKSTTLLERTDISALDCFKMMHHIFTKVQQRIEDNYYGYTTKQQLKKLPIHVQDYMKKDFNDFYQNILKYLNENYDFTDGNKLSKLSAFSLNSKIQYQDFETAIEVLNLENLIDTGKLYDEFCLAREALHSVSESNVSDIFKWMKFFTIICPLNIPNINSIVGFIFSIPGSNAHIERIFGLMRNRWSDVRNRTSVEMIKSELQILTNMNLTCKEFYNKIKTDTKLLQESKSTTKYDHKPINNNYGSDALC